MDAETKGLVERTPKQRAHGLRFNSGWWSGLTESQRAHYLRNPHDRAEDAYLAGALAGILEADAKAAATITRLTAENNALAQAVAHHRACQDAMMDEAARLTTLNQWQPIETAPKDGTELLLYPAIRREDTCCEGAWLSTKGGPCWVDLSVGHHNGYWKPTHWMPMPPGPNKEKQ